MNPIDKFLLRLFLLPTGIYVRLNVNMQHLRAILSAKLTMDNRRPSGFMQMNRKNEKKELSKSSLTAVFSSLLMGLFFMFTFVAGHDIVTKLTMFFSMYIVMIAMTMITDFTSVLIDVRDNMIILPKPVNDATFVTARLLHICIRTCMIVVPLSLPSGICVLFISGLGTLLLYFLMVIMSTLLAIFIINAIYILILKITTPAKFQSIISTIQIGFAIVIYASYQVLPRMMSQNNMMEANVSTIPFIRFMPPYWFAETCGSATAQGLNSGMLISMALSILVPLVSIWLVVRFFAPSFNRKLSMITASVSEKSKKDTATGKKSRRPLAERLGALLTQPGSEYMGFLFAWKMMSRSRDFKMKVFPSIGYLIVIVAMMFFRNGLLENVSLGSEKFIQKLFIILMYLTCVIIMTAIGQLPYSEKFKAGWIFDVTPIDAPGKVISGAIKSVIVFFFLPILLLLLPVASYSVGWQIVPHTLLACANVLTITSIMAYIMVRQLPFSNSMTEMSRGNTFIRSMFMLILPFALGVGHWLLADFLPFIIGVGLVISVVPWLVFDGIRKMGWEKISD